MLNNLLRCLLMLLTVSCLQNFVFGQHNRPLLEVVQLKLDAQGELFLTEQTFVEVKEEVLDSNGKPVMEITKTNNGPQWTPIYRTREMPTSVTKWIPSTKESLIFLDLNGKRLDHQATLQKFKQESFAVYLYAPFADIKQSLTLFNKDTILLLDGPKVDRRQNAFIDTHP